MNKINQSKYSPFERSINLILVTGFTFIIASIIGFIIFWNVNFGFLLVITNISVLVPEVNIISHILYLYGINLKTMNRLYYFAVLPILSDLLSILLFFLLDSINISFPIIIVIAWIFVPFLIIYLSKNILLKDHKPKKLMFKTNKRNFSRTHLWRIYLIDMFLSLSLSLLLFYFSIIFLFG